MLKGMVAYRKKIFKALSENYEFKILLLCCIAGIILGSFSSAQNADSGLSQITQKFFSMRASSGFFAVLLKSFLSSFSLIILSFLLGNFIFGCFAVGLIPFFKGFGIGTALGFMFAQYGAKGLAYSALVIIPAAVISALTVICAAVSSFRLSHSLLKKMLGRGVGKERFKYEFSDLCRNYLIYVLFCFVPALVEATLNLAFAGIFDLK